MSLLSWASMVKFSNLQLNSSTLHILDKNNQTTKIDNYKNMNHFSLYIIYYNILNLIQILYIFCFFLIVLPFKAIIVCQALKHLSYLRSEYRVLIY